MPKLLVPKRLPRERVTARIIDAAVALFTERGFAATTMQDVAAAVGMTAPALYYYFDSKQRLLFEVIELKLERFAELLEADVARGEADPAAALASFVRVHLAFQLSDPAGARIYNAMFLGPGDLLAALTPRQRAEILRFQRRVRDRLVAILEQGVAAGSFRVPDLTVTAMAILAMGEYAVSWFAPGGRLPAALIGDACAELALRMVTAARPTRGAR